MSHKNAIKTVTRVRSNHTGFGFWFNFRHDGPVVYRTPRLDSTSQVYRKYVRLWQQLPNFSTLYTWDWEDDE